MVSWVILVTAGDSSVIDVTSDEQTGINPSFFDFKKEVETIFSPNQIEKELQATKEPAEADTFDYELESGVSLERDYDFYADDDDDVGESKYKFNDVDSSGSNPVTVRTGFYPSAAASRY